MQTPTETPTIGHIGRYQLLSRIGAGGMGEVFLARTTGAAGFEKRVVLKRMLPHLAANPEFVQRFIDEGKLVVQLRHAGIAQVLDMGHEGGAIFLAMEHVDGRDLAELLRLARTGGAMPSVPVVLSIVGQLLDALDYAHRAQGADRQPMGIIHRDVSPSNVMISRSGEVKLLDFGIARATERLGRSTTGAIRGKYSYMSPEQAAGGRLDARSDQFSVGVVAWELLASSRPFDGDTDLRTLDRIRHHEPGSLKQWRPELPDDVASIVAKLLSKDPNGRFQTCHDAFLALQQCLFSAQTPMTSRDISAWFTEVVATLPVGLRDVPGAALSLDEALLLGLGLPSGGTGTPPALRAEAAAGGPSTGSYERPVTHAVALPPVFVPVPTTNTTQNSPNPARRAGFGLLILMNVVLLVVVTVFVFQEDDSALSLSSLEPDGAASTLASSEQSRPKTSIPEVGVSSDVEAVTNDDVNAKSNVGDTSPRPSLVEALVEPPLAVSGQRVGELFATSAKHLLMAPVVVQLRVVPTSGSINVSGRGASTGVQRLTLRPGTRISGRASAPGHVAQSFSLHAEEGASKVLRLKAMATGRVKFRFFPANAKVTIDGRAVLVGGGNVVEQSLPVGEHTVVISAGTQRLRRSFAVRADATANLKTLNAADAPGG